LSDHAVAARVATAAGRHLMALRVSAATGGAELGAAGDRSSHELIMGALGELRPGEPVLSEEAVDDPARLGAHRLWIVDPLDGTREFGEPGRTDWAVHVALVDRSGRPVAGAVALPAEDLTLATEVAPALPAPHAGPPRIIVSRSRPPAAAQTVADALGGEVITMGSAGAKAMAVVRGSAEVYLHTGGQHEWDSCAPVAVAAAAGLHTSRVDGSPLVYNRPDPWMPDLVVCRPEHAPAVLRALAGG